MKNILLIIVALCFAFSCDDQYSECTEEDYANCVTTKPDEAEMIVDVTINDENPQVPLMIYKGKLDDGNVIALDTAKDEEFRRFFPVDQYYTVTAKYQAGDKTVMAVDGNKMYKESRVLCDSTCWDIKGGIYDLRLKYAGNACDNY